MNIPTVLCTFAIAIGAVITIAAGSVRPQRMPLLVFCDVGQGDGAYIRMEDGFDAVIDGGRDGRMVSCLDQYRYPDDSSIDLVIVTHADSDHYAGLINVYRRFPVRYTILPSAGSSDASYAEFRALVASHSAVMPPPQLGDSLRFGSAVFRFLWPGRETKHSQCLHDRNSCSYVHLFSYQDFDVLFTGDVTRKQLNRILLNNVQSLEVIKVPHHGSAGGLSPQLVSKLNPQSAVISVGKKNPYKHPDESIIRMLQGRTVYRTDSQGAIIFRLPRSPGQAK
ncbi:MAG: MBL fold metallo-hydrolase [Patescibacteria group bacterium]|nr:MBL fold metallo-hydrolase [Patescibacteria group bacterium]